MKLSLISLVVSAIAGSSAQHPQQTHGRSNTPPFHPGDLPQFKLVDLDIGKRFLLLLHNGWIKTAVTIASGSAVMLEQAKTKRKEGMRAFVHYV